MKSIDMVLTTSEIKDLIDEHIQDFNSIEYDHDYKLLYNFETGFENLLKLTNSETPQQISEDFLRSQKISEIDLRVNSSNGNGTSNNYLYSALSI